MNVRRLLPRQHLQAGLTQLLVAEAELLIPRRLLAGLRYRRLLDDIERILWLRHVLELELVPVGLRKLRHRPQLSIAHALDDEVASLESELAVDLNLAEDGREVLVKYRLLDGALDHVFMHEFGWP